MVCFKGSGKTCKVGSDPAGLNHSGSTALLVGLANPMVFVKTNKFDFGNILYGNILEFLWYDCAMGINYKLRVFE